MNDTSTELNNIQKKTNMDIPNANIDPISLREYGRNIQNLMRRIRQVPEKEARTAYAKALIPLMRIVNPTIQQHNKSPEKIWHDIFSIADYNLDVVSPYPIPTNSSLTKKPTPIPYMKQPFKYKRYGRNILATLEKVKKITDKAHAELILFQMAKWILTFHKKHTGTEDILYYFRDVIGKNALPDLALVKQKIQEFTPPNKNGKNQTKRYFRKRRKS